VPVALAGSGGASAAAAGGGAEEDEARVTAALGPGSNAEVLASSSVCNIDISRKDMRCLSGLNWLNDEVINFYMSLLQEREHRLSPGARARAPWPEYPVEVLPLRRP